MHPVVVYKHAEKIVSNRQITNSVHSDPSPLSCVEWFCQKETLYGPTTSSHNGVSNVVLSDLTIHEKDWYHLAIHKHATDFVARTLHRENKQESTG